MATLQGFVVGSCSHPECMVLQGGSWRAREFPARAWLIESRGKRILWDTGYASHFLSQARGIYRLYPAITPMRLGAEEGLRAQLQRQGITLESIDALVLSHMHADHLAGVVDFPGVPLFSSAAALSSIQGVSGFKQLLQAYIPGLLPDALQARMHLVENLPGVVLPKALHCLGVGRAFTDEVICVKLPGHAKGHLGLAVHTSKGWELIATDAAWDARAYEDLRGPSPLTFLIQDNRREYYATLRKLQDIHRWGVPIHLSHAPVTDASIDHPVVAATSASQESSPS